MLQFICYEFSKFIDGHVWADEKQVWASSSEHTVRHGQRCTPVLSGRGRGVEDLTGPAQTVEVALVSSAGTRLGSDEGGKNGIVEPARRRAEWVRPSTRQGGRGWVSGAHRSRKGGGKTVNSKPVMHSVSSRLSCVCVLCLALTRSVRRLGDVELSAWSSRWEHVVGTSSAWPRAHIVHGATWMVEHDVRRNFARHALCGSWRGPRQ
jgi:hypothetical protein